MFFHKAGGIRLLLMGDGEEWPYGTLRKWEGRNRNALPLRSEPSSAKLENTSLSAEGPLGFLYAAFPLPPLQNEKCYISLHEGEFPPPLQNERCYISLREGE